MLIAAPVLPENRPAALEVLLATHPPEERIALQQNLLVSTQVSLDGLLWVCDDQHPVAALLIVLQPDGTAFVWPPSIVAPDPDQQIEAVLFKRARQWLDASACRFAQCLLEPEAVEARAQLIRQGFPAVTTLLLMVRPLKLPFAPPREIFPTLAFESGLEQRFAEVLERTYIGSRDCPQLHGVRKGIDALRGYRLTGEFAPERWLLVRFAEADVGVLLLAAHPTEQLWEIVYLGVVPEFRRRGLGAILTSMALQRAAAAGASGVFLAVDEQNREGLGLYRKSGFVIAGRRGVHLRFPAEGAP